MARWSSRRGPAANFELTAAFTTPTGFIVARVFGRGILQLICTASINADGGVGGPKDFRFVVDGTPVPNYTPRNSVDGFTTHAVCYVVLHPITEGFHTIEAQFAGNAAAGDRLLQDRCEFIVIELPAWDTDNDLTIL